MRLLLDNGQDVREPFSVCTESSFQHAQVLLTETQRVRNVAADNGRFTRFRSPFE